MISLVKEYEGHRGLDTRVFDQIIIIELGAINNN